MDVLAGMDAVPWATLDHCFGASDDIPDLLRQTADGSKEALETLGGYMVHQGTLYEATPYLVSFLARIAASGVMPVGILGWLGAVADCDDESQAPERRGKTRAALAAETSVLAPLLADPAAAVRHEAAWALPQSRAAEPLVPLLRDRWDHETNPAIAASVLRGLSFLDPEGTMPLAAGALDSPDSIIRLIAALACVEGGAPWSDALAEAALAWTIDGTLMKGFQWSFMSGHPFSDLIGALAERGDPAAAAGLASAALTRPAAPGVRELAVLAASNLVESSRSAAPVLIAPLTSVAVGDDEKAGVSAILDLRQMRALDQAADQLAAVADTEGPSRRADWALTCLVEIGDPRCVSLIIRDGRHRRFAAGALLGTGQVVVRPPFTPGLLEEVRACLRGQLLGEKSTPHLIRLIGSWGQAAAAAIPDLLGILPRHEYQVGWALADIAGATPDAVRLLRQEASGGTNLHAAARLHTLTGDEQPLLAAIESGLAQTGYAQSRAAEAARSLTPHHDLIPVLADALQATSGRAGPDDGTRIKLALALWHHSGDPAPAIEAIAGKLDAEAARPGYGSGAAAAASAAAAMGPVARPLIPAIVPLIESPDACTAAVRALLRIDPDTHGGVPVEELAVSLMLPLGRAWGHTQLTAIQTLGEIGLHRLPASVVTRLRELADQDQRIAASGAVQDRIRDDDQIRAAIRELIDDTPQPTPSGQC